jgi:hypothetical protein
MLTVREAFLTTLVVPEATAAGTGWPPSPDGPTPGETGASPEDDAEAEGVEAAAGAPPAAIWASDAYGRAAASGASEATVVGTTVPAPPAYPSVADAAPFEAGIALEDKEFRAVVS